MAIDDVPLIILDSDEEDVGTTRSREMSDHEMVDWEDAPAHASTPRSGLHRELPIIWQESTRRKGQRKGVTPDELDFWASSNRLHLTQKGVILATGTDVELHGEVFLRVHDILTNPLTLAKFLRGHVFLRNGQPLSPVAKDTLACSEQDMADFLPEQPNELHMSYQFVACTTHSENLQALRLFPVECFVRIRSVIVTNQLFPALSQMTATGDLVYNEQPDDLLICRWITVKSWTSLKNRETETQTYCRRSIHRIRQCESDIRAATDDTQLMHDFRGKTMKGGEAYGIHQAEHERRQYEADRLREASDQFLGRLYPRPFTEKSRTVRVDDSSDSNETSRYIELAEDDACGGTSTPNDTFWSRTQEFTRPMLLPRLQRYSFADIFAGCGGVTVAAAKAGFCAKYAVEWEPAMCATYLLNNPGSRVACADVRDFVHKYVYNMRVDIMHLSPPCQPFSKAHTTPGRGDNINKEALGMLEACLMRARPRIVTIEEADALATFSKHSEHLQRIMLQFTMLNYSVEFQVINFADYGVCQKRQRLVIVASCPGQRLPGFPEKTHVDYRSLPHSTLFPWVTTEEAIAEIPHMWTHHNPADERLLREGNEAIPRTLCQTLITKNAHLLHPEGWRRFTVMEKLVIQGFPLHFEFPNTQRASDMAKQIGNAVPPRAFEVLFRHIQRELLREDGLLDKRTGERMA